MSSIAIGRVTRAHGIRGELRVELHNAASRTLEAVEELELVPPGGAASVYRVLAVRAVGGGAWLLRLEGIDDRDAAAACARAEVRVPRAAVVVGPDELLLADLVGCAVVDPAGAPIGTVDGIETLPAQDCLRVRTAAGLELVPMVDAFVKEIDLPARRVVVEMPVYED